MKKLGVVLGLIMACSLGYAQDTIQAQFSAVNVCDGSEVVFTNTSKVPVKFGGGNYYWTFGDGSTSTLQFPKHQYTLADPKVEERFEVKLVVQSKSIPSEKDSMIDFVSIYPNPDASFVWDVDNKGNTQDVIIVSQGTSDPSNFYQWNLAGVVKSNDITPKFLHADVKPYLDGSDYNFTLLVRTPDACETTYTTKFNYNPLSIDDIEISQNLVYPNPSSGVFNLKEPLSAIVIRDFAGKVVHTQNAVSTEIELECAKGMYSLTAIKNGQPVSQKLMVN
jgi:hypothetical protein